MAPIEAGTPAHIETTMTLASLSFAPEFLPLIRSGAKRATTRLLRSDPVHGLGVGVICVATCAETGALGPRLEITATEDLRVAAIDDTLAQVENYQTVAELVVSLQRFYPDLAADDTVRVLYFRCADPAG